MPRRRPTARCPRHGAGAPSSIRPRIPAATAESPAAHPMSSPEPAGYSGTPLPKKLGIKPGHRIRLIGAPEGFGGTPGELPQPVEIVAEDDEGGAPLDLVLFFTDSADALRAR